MPPGSYTVTYSALAGHITPAAQTLSVAEGSQAIFSGLYMPVATIIRFQ